MKTIRVGDLVQIIKEGAAPTKPYIVVKVDSAGFYHLYGKLVPYMAYELKVVSPLKKS